MNTQTGLIGRMWRSSALRGGLLLGLALASFGIATVQSQATLPPTVAIAADPLYSRGIRSKPTLTLSLSVEFPTVGAQYLDADYASTNEYVGYFDPDSCYSYNNNSDPALRRFDRSGPATARRCGGTGFSGNFMNWATSSAIDVLRYGLTGGDRVVDTTTVTVLQRAVLQEGFYNSSNFPSKRLPAATASQSVPTALIGSHTGDIYVANCLNRVHFGTAASGSCGSPGTNSNLGISVGAASNSTPVSYVGTLPAGYTDCAAENGNCAFTGIRRVYYGAGSLWNVVSANNGIACTNGVFGDPIVGTAKRCYMGNDPSGWTPGGSTGLTSDNFFYSRVAVCGLNASNNLADSRSNYCLRYPSGNFKPIGNLQKYSDSIRVAAFGYLNDSTGNPSQRYGGVLRAPMKYVGPKSYDSNYSLVAGANPKQEWDSTTGVFLRDPDSASGATGGTGSNWPGQTISGVINYLNQFGRTGATQGQYKTYDPVGELYYESLRYIQGLPPTADATAGMTTAMKDGYPVYTTWDDPHPPVAGMSDYKCVKNNIVLIGDVNTHNDKTYPGNTRVTNDALRLANAAANEPNFVEWTKVVGKFEAGQNYSYRDGRNDLQNTTGNLAPNSARDGMETQAIGADNASYYMAGAAYWANTHDIRGSTWTDQPTKQRPGMRLTTYILDVNEYGAQSNAGARWNNQFFLAAKYGGFDDVTGTGNPYKKLDGSTVVSDPSNLNWMRPGSGGEAKNYFLSSSARAVLDALDEIFANIAKGANSIAGAAVTTQSVATGNGGVIYQARFDPAAWSGDVIPITVTAVGEDGVSLGNEATAPWTAAAKLDAKDSTTRKIFLGDSSVNPSTTAREFKWSSIDTATQNQLRLPPGAASAPYDSAAIGEARLNYLRGVRTGEGSTYRFRTSVLGDIVNSGIAYSGAPPKTVSDPAYASFSTANATRAKALFVGANDGMLHAFNAADGNELFAYVPSWMMPNMTLLTTTTYVHRAFVDATPVVSEAKVGSAWKTVLVGGTGGGGQGVYALDVSDPGSFSAANVMWEFTDKHDTALGNVVGRPQILKFRTSAGTVTPATYKYFAVVASGVNNYAADGNASTTGYPALFLLDLSKPAGTSWTLGANYFRIDIPRASSARAQGMINFTATGGLAGEVNYIYAGDLQGNLWKLDFTTQGTAGWNMNALSFFKNGTAPVPMFIASDGTRTQPITMSPTIAYGLAGTYLVAFGTGKFLEAGDVASPYYNQSLYAIYDDNKLTTPLDSPSAAIAGRGRLQANTASAGGAITPGATFVWGRPASDTDLSKRAGWYFDFAHSSSGERQISSFAILGGKLIAGTIVPAGNSCEDGSGYQYIVDLFTGGGSYSISEVGIAGEPLVLRLDNSIDTSDTDTTGARRQRVRYGILSQGSGGLAPSLPPQEVTTVIGRMSWRQLNINR